jgi:hypothetical protein
MTPKEIKEACERIWLDKHFYYPSHRAGWFVWRVELRPQYGRKYNEIKRKRLKYKID